MILFAQLERNAYLCNAITKTISTKTSVTTWLIRTSLWTVCFWVLTVSS